MLALARDDQGATYCLIQECSRAVARLPHQNGPVTAKLCELATALQFARFVKSAGLHLQGNRDLPHCRPVAPSGEVSKDKVDAWSASV